MGTQILKNSYVILILCFIILCIVFYIFQIGCTTELDREGRVVKRFSWKYPLAISLIVWIVWHYWLYPPPEEKEDFISEQFKGGAQNSEKQFFRMKQIDTQKINMINWI